MPNTTDFFQGNHIRQYSFSLRWELTLKKRILERILEELFQYLEIFFKFSSNLYETYMKGNKKIILYVLTYGQVPGPP